ncbi:MAG: cytochrome b/b6 domain-containing protein [Pseudomonadota bacterium]|nr:cytochrome b/b6 domain-containing protein [Pseudomonadota bacterium]
MKDLPKGSDRSAYFALHKSVGLTVFLLAALRLVWRATHPRRRRYRRRWPGGKTSWRVAITGSCTRSSSCSRSRGIYRLPSVAIALASSGFPLPQWGWKEPFLNELFTDIHEASAITLAVLVGVHVLAAVAHAVRPGDHLFRRMLPRSLVP